MEKPELKSNNEITLVKKGFFYLVFQIIALPFKGLFWVLKKFWKYVMIYAGWYREHSEYAKNQKNLKTMLSRNANKGEII